MENNQPTNPWESPRTEATEATATTRGRRPGRALAFVAAGAIGATALTGMAFAATNSPSPSANGDSSTNGGPANPETQNGARGDGKGPMGDHDGDGKGRGMRGGADGKGMRGGPGGEMGMRGFGGRVLHGEAVVTKQDGTTATMRVQKGEVTAASATEITIKSSDGFEQTWPLTADTKIHRDRADATAADIKVGDTAMAVGEVTGGTVTTNHVGVLSPEQAKAMEQRQADRRAQHDAEKGQAAPSPTPTS